MKPVIFHKMTAPIRNSIKNLIARSIVRVVKDSTNMQLLQIEVLAGEVKSDVERVQNYGFSSVPKDGSEALVLFIGGNKDHAIVTAVDDSRVRKKDLKAGEVVMYDGNGSFILLKDDKSIEHKSDGDQTFNNSGKIFLGGDKTMLPITGVVTGQNLDPVLGIPFPDHSLAVFARKV